MAFPHYEAGRWKQAIEQFTFAMNADPLLHMNSLAARADSYRRLGYYELAIKDGDLMIKREPKVAKHYSDRGLAYYYLGQYQRSIQNNDMAIQLDPNYALAYNNRGVYYRKLGQHTKADADKAKACSLDSKYC
jgi:tetratricopeptide (TPR) repeat protein